MSLEKREDAPGESAYCLCFLGLMRANRNELARLILLCWRSLRHGNTAETQPLARKILRAIVWKEQEASNKSKNSFSLDVFAYLGEKTMKRCCPVIHALGLRGKGFNSGLTAILSLSNISIPLSAKPLFLSGADIWLLCAETSEWSS